MIRLFFTIAAFLLITTKGQRNCSLWIRHTSAPHMPLVYKVNNKQEASIVYPNSNARFLIQHNASITLSCVSTRFLRKELQNFTDITVTCLGLSMVRFQDKKYLYADLKCKNAPKSTMMITKKVCQPNNNTVVRVGFRTQKYYFPLYNACFDMVTLSTLYTWYNLRKPFYNKHETRPRSRLFTMVRQLYRSFNVNMRYTILEQQKTLNGILKFRPDTKKLVNNINFLSRGHLASMPEFFYAREQRATFNYVNVVPQWKQLNEYWGLVEKKFRCAMPTKRYNRRVIMAGTYKVQTVPDAYNRDQPLYLIMPETKISVPFFLWRLYYDADDKDYNFVYIGMLSPFATQEQVDNNKLRCDEIPCPVPSIVNDNRTAIFQLYCCTIESFQAAFGGFQPEVFQEQKILPFR